MPAPANNESPPYVTKKDIQEYLALEDRRKALNREAEDLRKQAEVIQTKLMSFCRYNGSQCERSGYRLSITLASGFPAWKQAFIRVAGMEEAARVSRECPKREVLKIDPA